ncbi:protein rolling stone-like [Watersipora subatra]|uniref:protein rolling stone-like n=1 Tax=Watersipora subatra TaxID=2589382 RepID=UPI00355BDB11
MKLNWFLYELTSGETILISLLFWSLIYNEDYPIYADTYVTHGVNGLYVLIDIWITAMPVKILHVYLPFLLGLSYIIFSIIYDYSGGTNALGMPYIYSVLDWSDGVTWPLIYCGGAAVVVIIIHFIFYGCFKLRVWLYKYRKGDDNSSSSVAYEGRQSDSRDIEKN